ncbi:alpha/beta hydrolase [Acinetobacter pollinis]|jgi:epsilon-lactone hydrolase|uniref:alpha/beta hydrolase n=2 Tax=Acinetobacter pollinis TaxID=2605270 RepID=UPI0018C33F80|nr:alpha/beta hydrolase [Acinetobacter pollinis]MBF7693347.1 alpha/beta hydrolase [Acinetobacter pollinis]MBF7701204.1 alpha/beta hydrolase [Acinetobacter pollinis]
MNMQEMWKQWLTEALLKTTIRYPSQGRFSPQINRFYINHATSIFPLHKQDITVEKSQLAGLNIEKITPTIQTNEYVILYLHGGGFHIGSLKSHRAWLYRLAQVTQTQVIHLEYPLAPEVPFPTSSESIYNAYLALLESGVDAQNIILAGDDSGANLALALTQRFIRKQSVPLPRALMLFSPFLDLTLTSRSIRSNQKHDALTSLQFLQKSIHYYTANTNFEADDPRISPLYGDLTGLPPLLIQVGSKSLLLDDAKRLKEMAEAVDITVDYQLYTGMWHNFFMFNEWFEEGKQALVNTRSFIEEL